MIRLSVIQVAFIYAINLIKTIQYLYLQYFVYRILRYVTGHWAELFP